MNNPKTVSSEPPRVVVRRLDFYGGYAYPALARANAYREAWKLAVEERGTHVQRKILRAWMRSSAIEAKNEAYTRAAERTSEAAFRAHLHPSAFAA